MHYGEFKFNSFLKQTVIDRNGKHFGSILNFLRDGQIPLPDTRRELLELQAEAKYFCIDELSSACEANLSKMGCGDWGGDLVPICRSVQWIFIITPWCGDNLL